MARHALRISGRMTMFSEGDERRLVYLLQTNENLAMLAQVLAEAVPGRRDDASSSAHLVTHREIYASCPN